MAININFNLRNPKRIGETPINIIIRYNGIQIVHPSGERIDPQFWESENAKKRNFQRVKKGYRSASEINSRLDDISAKAQRIYSHFIAENNRIPDKHEYKALLSAALGQVSKYDEAKNVTLIEFIESQIIKSKERFNPITGKILSVNTIKPYKTLLGHLRKFQKISKKRIDWDNLDNRFYDDFISYLTTVNLKVNTIGKQFQVLNTFVKQAERLDIIPFGKIKNFKVIREEVDSISLSKGQLIEWQQLDLSNDLTLEIARDIFTLACYTGSRYSDIGKFKNENIKEINGMRIFVIVQQKTQKEVHVPVHPVADKILQKYDGCIPNIPPSQKMNKRLKIIARMIPSLQDVYHRKYSNGNGKVTEAVRKYEMVSTHTARRTFASIQYINGVPTHFIMSVTGHKKESDFYKYIRVPNIDKAKAVYQIWQGQS